AMPLLGLREERFNPHLPLPDRLLVGLRRMVAADFVQVVDGERALHLAAMIAGGAFGLDRAGVADGGVAAVGHHAFGMFGGIAVEGMPLRAAVLITLGIEDEVVLSVEVGAVGEVG